MDDVPSKNKSEKIQHSILALDFAGNIICVYIYIYINIYIYDSCCDDIGIYVGYRGAIIGGCRGHCNPFIYPGVGGLNPDMRYALIIGFLGSRVW